MELRLGNKEDIEVILEILKEVVKNNNKYTKWRDEYPNREIVNNDIENKELYVIVKENNIIGAVTLNEVEDSNYSNIKWTNNGKAIVVHRLFISFKESGKGYGKEIINKIIEVAKELNYCHIRLDTHEDNIVAQGLYKRSGFTLISKMNFEDLQSNFYMYEYNIL